MSKQSELTLWLKTKKKGLKNFHPFPYVEERRFILCVCWSVLRKVLNNFWKDGSILRKISWFVWLLLGSYWWVVPLSSSLMLGLIMDPVLFHDVYLRHGQRCYQVMTYHFGNHLTRETKMWEQIFYFRPRPALVGYEAGDSEGVIIF